MVRTTAPNGKVHGQDGEEIIDQLGFESYKDELISD